MSDSTGSVAYVIPTYNRWPRVCRAIDSVLAAGAAAVVVDDASTDGTAEQLAAAYGARVTLVRQPQNREKSAARNAGLAAATAEFVGFLDSDDTLLPGGVAALVGVYRAAPAFAGVAYGACQAGATVEAAPAALPSGQVLGEYVRRPFLHTPAFLLRRQTLLAIGAYREELTNLEDVELFVRLMARLEFRNCGAVVARFDKQADSASANDERIVAQELKLLACLRQDETAIQALGPAFAVLAQRVYREYGRALYRTGRWRAYRALWRAGREQWPAWAGDGTTRRRYWYATLRTWLGG